MSEDPTVLWEVLLKEYEELGVLAANAEKRSKNKTTPETPPNIEAEYNESFAKLKEIRDEIHKIPKGDLKTPTAICFSGGGIRSATFGLGILQGLVKHQLIDKFTYLSSVSGGGYLASWLSAWMYRTGKATQKSAAENQVLPDSGVKNKKSFSTDEIEEIQKKLVGKSPDLPEPLEVTHLRTYSNYLSPRVGLLSTDTWTLIAIYLRNLFLNWTVFIPLIAALLLLPKVFILMLNYVAGISKENNQWQWIILVFAMIMGGIGIALSNTMRPSLKNYSWIGQNYKRDDIGIYKSSSAWAIVTNLVLLVLMAIGLTSYWYWNHLDTSLSSTFIRFTVFSVLIFIGGYFLSWLFMLNKFLKRSEPELVSECDETQSSGYFQIIWEIWDSKLCKFFRSFFKTYVSEVIYSIICGAIGGALLFWLVRNLSWLSLPIYNTFLQQTNFNSQQAVQQTIQQTGTSFSFSLSSVFSSTGVSTSGGMSGADIHTALYVCFGLPLVLLVFQIAAAIFTGIAVRITDDEDREWMARFGAILLTIIVGWGITTTAVIFGPQIFSLNWSGTFTSIGGISGLLTLLLGFSGKGPAKQGDEDKNWTSYLIWIASSILAPVFLLFLVILISHLTNKLMAIEGLNYPVIWCAGLAVVGILMGFFININKFSFHSTYRERLIRAYLGASRTKKRLECANSFTGLDTNNDNLEIKNLRQKPFHVINMTLNLVRTNNLAWQNRKAESFTATALHCGSSNMGSGVGNYRDSSCYGYNKQNKLAMTLGTAMTISGAAASPNMGYFTQSTAVSILMVLFNVRLGWWLGNPGRRGIDTYKLPAPRWSPKVFFAEALGLTDDEYKYVYLADGGQFENLGLYEMVLRRCKLIVVCDGGADPDFSFFDLGSAIHKIRVDMGIPIEFEEEKPEKGRYCAIANIKYSAVDKDPNKETTDEEVSKMDGVLIYIKPTLNGAEPIDIMHYYSENPAFPHETTADQFYSETQFESYRSLGCEVIEKICGVQKVVDLEDFKGRAEAYAAATKTTGMTQQEKKAAGRWLKIFEALFR